MIGSMELVIEEVGRNMVAGRLRYLGECAWGSPMELLSKGEELKDMKIQEEQRNGHYSARKRDSEDNSGMKK
jgi:hypothetical protein